MPPSQLKQLKASLRENGITGPSQKKKKNGKTLANGANKERNAKRNASLQGIRETFNPFEYKQSTRPEKFAVTTYGTLKKSDAKQKASRPGVTKSLGEESRRRTLLPEIQRRHKVGGIIDRRIGENDPTMTPEDRMLQRFARVAQRRKRDDVYNLEEADEEDQLTHLGRSILTETGLDTHDDFEETNLGWSDEESGEEGRLKKRRRLLPETMQVPEPINGHLAEVKKSKKEIMDEVISKSKFHKYERQQAKEEDNDVRETLDKALPDLLAALRGANEVSHRTTSSTEPQVSTMHPDRAAIVEHHAKANLDKQYDQQLRQMAMEKKATPTERTKTDDEVAEAKARHLRELEEQRLRRMRGEQNASDEEDSEVAGGLICDENEQEDQAAEFGFQNTTKMHEELDVEDEDEFVIDEDLVASGSEIDSDFYGLSEEEEEDPRREKQEADEDEDFLREVMTTGSNGAPDSSKCAGQLVGSTTLAFTFPCPQTHSQLLQVFKNIPLADYPIAVQRLRTLYNPKLKQENKEKLGNFSKALVDHLSFMADMKPPLLVIEAIIRHIHSLSRTYADIIARAIRAHLLRMHQSGSLTPGDLLILTAVSSIFPTSDHFHQVVTPAVTIMARWLGLINPKTDEEHQIGAYLVALFVKYQKLSKRYVPEAIRFTLAALISRPSKALVIIHTDNLLSLSELWATKSAFIEMFSPSVLQAFEALHQRHALRRLRIALSQSRLNRRPLELHHHRPLAIKSSIPKFEEYFNPDKHYDPDRERAEASKLRAEYKREHKGALRELKKDAMFIAREKLKEKKEKDRAYEAKQRRLIAEIQGEEGREKNAYEREKRARKGRR